MVNDSSMKILIRVPNWIGDAVLCLPAIEAIRSIYPGSEISILAKPWVRDVFLNNPAVDRIVIYDRDAAHKGMKGFIRLIVELRAEGYDMAILFQNAFEAALLTWLSRIPVRVGYSRDGRGVLLSRGFRPSPRIMENRHHLYYYLKIAEILGYKTGDMNIRPRIPLTKEEDALASAIIEEMGIKRPFVGIHPGASYGRAKRWKTEGFASVARGLIERMNLSIALFGGMDDRGIGEEIVSCVDSPYIYNVIGRLPLRSSIALINKACLFITNDTGPMHIASALSVPIVAIFGSTDPALTGPIGGSFTVIRKELMCSPCFERECPEGDYRCMEMIEPEEVLSATISLIKGNGYSEGVSNTGRGVDVG